TTKRVINSTLSQNFVSGNRQGLYLTSAYDLFGNRVGTTNHTRVFGNVFANSSEDGILLEGSSDNTIGGNIRFGQPNPTGNVISNNQSNGIFLKPDENIPSDVVYSDRNQVVGNFIGVDQTGKLPFGNSNAGVYIDGGSFNVIGGTT